MKDENKIIDWILFIAVSFFIIGIVVGLFIEVSEGGEIITPETYTPQEICNAIWFAEGGENAQYKYGIRSVKYTDTDEARDICVRSFVRNKQRYYDYGYREFADYLRFASRRWCPIGAGNDPKGLNVNWYSNVLWFLENPKEIK